MSKAMMKRAAATALAPKSFAQWMQLAETLAQSSLVPKEFKGKPGDVLVAMQMGASVGLNPFQAIQSIAVINGKPCMWGDAVLGICYASNLLEDIQETDDGQAATCTVKRKGKPTPTVRTFSMKDALEAKVYQQDAQGNGKWISLSERAVWRSYAGRMRQMRARSWALRDTFPDVLKGLAVREEVEDYGDEPAEAKPIGGKTLEERMADLAPREKALAEPAAIEPPVVVQEPPAFTDREQEPQPDTEPVAPGQTPAETPTPKLTFAVGQQTIVTNGVDRATLMEIFKVSAKVDKKLGANKAAEALKKEFDCDHRTELNKEQGWQYLARLKEMLE